MEALDRLRAFVDDDPDLVFESVEISVSRTPAHVYKTDLLVRVSAYPPRPRTAIEALGEAVDVTR
jgi:hypothetical protein